MRTIAGMRSLFVQLVPDDVASVRYTFTSGLLQDAGTRPHSPTLPARSNTTVTVLDRAGTAFAAPREELMRNQRGQAIRRVVASPQVPIPPQTACPGETRPHPNLRRVGYNADTTWREFCARIGLPVAATHRGEDDVFVLYHNNAFGYMVFEAIDGRLVHGYSTGRHKRFPLTVHDGIDGAPRLRR